MSKILAFIVGLIIGKTAIKVILDIIIFDIPFTKKLKKYPGAGNTAAIMGGSVLPLVLWVIIVVAIFCAFSFLSKAVMYFIYGAVAASIFYRQNKDVLLTLYRNKHIQNISPRFAITTLSDNPDTRLADYDMVIKLIDAFAQF